MKTETLSVPKIHCSSCVLLLESIEDELPGIEEVSVNIGKREMTVYYDEHQTNINEIIQTVEAVAGYEAIKNDH